MVRIALGEPLLGYDEWFGVLTQKAEKANLDLDLLEKKMLLLCQYMYVCFRGEMNFKTAALFLSTYRMMHE
jgi:hypothetical protein